MNILLIAVVSALWRLGGWSRAKWSGYRDVLIPVIMLIYYWVTMNFLIGFLTAGATNTIRIGYGAYDPEHDDKPSWLAKITKDREGWKIRGIYGAITAFAIGLFPVLYHFYLNEYSYIFNIIFYIILNVGVEVGCNKLKFGDTLTELLNGAARGLVFLICR